MCVVGLERGISGPKAWATCAWPGQACVPAGEGAARPDSQSGCSPEFPLRPATRLLVKDRHKSSICCVKERKSVEALGKNR